MAWVIVSSRTRAEILFAAWLMVLPGAEAAPLPLDSWQSLHQARLAEAAALDFEGAERSYRQLIQNLAADDPLREEALYSWPGCSTTPALGRRRGKCCSRAFETPEHGRASST